MKRTPILLITLMFIAAPLAAQTRGNVIDQQAIKSIARQWQETWNRHDMKALAALLTEDVDLITVGGAWLRGRKEFEEDHTKGHETIFKGSVLTVNNTEVKFIRPDVAVAHAEWSIKFGESTDGALRQPQQGIFTWVLKKGKGTWSIIAAQNTIVREQASRK